MSQETATIELPPRPEELAAPTRVRYGVIGFLCVLAFLTYFDRICITSAQADIKRDLGLNNNQMGWVLGAFWLAYGFFEIPGGWMGDRFGARQTLTRIVLAWSLFTALSGAATGFVSLLAYRFLFGVGEAGAYPNMARVQSRWFPPRVQARMGGVLWLVSRWGGALSYLIFPSLLIALDSPGTRHFLARTPVLRVVSQVHSWRLGFWVCGFAGLAWVAAFFPWFRDDPAAKRGVNAAEARLIRAGRPAEETAAHPRFDARIWRGSLSSGPLWAVALAYLGSSFGWSFFVSWMNQFLLDVYHEPYRGSLWLKTGPLLCGGAACLVGGSLSDLVVRRTGRQRAGRILFPVGGALSAAIAMYCIRFAHTPQQAVSLMCVASFMLDLGQAPAWATIISMGGAYAGTAFGFVNMVANPGGNFLGPVIGSYVSTKWGWNAALAVYAAAFVFCGCLWCFADPTQRFYVDSPRTERA